MTEITRTETGLRPASYNLTKLPELVYLREYGLTGDFACLEKSRSILMKKSFPGPLGMEQRLFAVLLELLYGEFEEAERLFSDFRKSKAFYKSRSSKIYMITLFLEFYYDFARGKMRLAEKRLDSLIKAPDDLESLEKSEILTFTACACACLEKNREASAYLSQAYTLGFGLGSFPVLFYVTLYRLAKNGEGLEGTGLAYPLLKWAVNKNIDLRTVLEANISSVISDQKIILELGASLYKAYPFDWLLAAVCNSLIKKGDCSQRAYDFYKEAEYRQLELSDLYYYLIKSAYGNSVENVSRYSIEQFLKQKKTELRLQIFVYHLIISGKQNIGILKLHEKKIAEFGAQNLGLGQKDRYFNSIYKFMFESGERLGISPNAIMEAKRRLGENLFKYDAIIENPAVRSIWVYEKELRDMKAYSVADGKAEISAISEEFSYFLMTDGQKSIISDKIRLKKRVQNAGINLYKAYLSDDFSQTELLVALARHATGLEKSGGEWINVLEKTLADQKVSRRFKMQTNACLGSIYAARGEFDKAVSYFSECDENYLNDILTENMLLAYVNAGVYLRAVELIRKKAHLLSEKSLFYTVKRIVQQNSDFCGELADTAYGLILNGWYDKALIGVVLQYYHGSQSDWHELSKTLDSLSISEPGLDEIILKSSIWMHMFDKGSQSVFARIAERSPEISLLGDYATYCAYEIMINNQKPEYLTIDLLERRYLESRDEILAFALCHYYINYSVQTLHSDQVLNEAFDICEARGIIFPVFKKLEDKSLLRPYIEKNQPFMFIGRPDTSVFLHYRFENGKTEYRVKKMNYFKFGIFLTHVACFYNEKIYYYFSEESATGSVESKEAQAENRFTNISEKSKDLFFIINNALIYEQLFKYDKVESIITDRLKEGPRFKSWILPI